MKKTNLSRLAVLILCVVLVAAMALMTTGCKNATEETPDTADDVTTVQDTTAADDSEEENESVLGEGENQFTFKVVDKEGNETVFTVNTDKKIVGEALLDLGLIEGEDGDYGLYVKKVNGIEADYDKDQTYWAFYVDGEMAMTGVDMTDIKEGAVYGFKVEK
jgi:hypothetical protein